MVAQMAAQMAVTMAVKRDPPRVGMKAVTWVGLRVDW